MCGNKFQIRFLLRVVILILILVELLSSLLFWKMAVDVSLIWDRRVGFITAKRTFLNGLSKKNKKVIRLLFHKRRREPIITLRTWLRVSWQNHGANPAYILPENRTRFEKYDDLLVIRWSFISPLRCRHWNIWSTRHYQLTIFCWTLFDNW